jgi:hypothetical protein
MLILLKGSGGGGWTYPKGVQTIRNSFGIGSSVNVVSNWFSALPSHQRILLSMGEPIEQNIQTVKNTLSDVPLDSVVQTVKNTIDENNFVKGIIATVMELDDIDPVFPSTAWDIFLDSKSIKSQVAQAQIRYSEDTVHNEIEIQSIDRNLFLTSDPDVLSGTARIEVHIDSRIIYFLLESKQGDETNFNLWGRSLSAADDSPHSDAVELELTSPASAKETAESLLTVNSLLWGIVDWTLPVGFEFSGDPVDGVKSISNLVGAVARCADDGTIVIRQKYPTRPVYMQGTTPTVSYDRSENMIKLNYETIKGTGYDCIEVHGNADDVELPDIEVEESPAYRQQDAHLRVFWPGTIPDVVSSLATAGYIDLLGASWEGFTEEVVFSNGSGSVSRPVSSITSYTWIGTDGGEISIDSGKKLSISGAEWAIATVVYRSEFQRYRIRGHNVSVLLAVLSTEGNQGTTVRVVMGTGESEAPNIKNDYIIGEPAAVVAGTAWLDDNRYDKQKVKVRAPYDENALDGVLAYVNNPEIKIYGSFKIASVSINFSGPQIISEMELIKCLV